MLSVINDTGILVVLAAAVMLFGASRIPKLARNLGEASKEFKRAQDELHAEPAAGPQALTAAPERLTITRTQLDELLASGSGHQPAPGTPAS